MVDLVHLVAGSRQVRQQLSLRSLVGRKEEKVDVGVFVNRSCCFRSTSSCLVAGGMRASRSRVRAWNAADVGGERVSKQRIKTRERGRCWKTNNKQVRDVGDEEGYKVISRRCW